MTADTYSNTLGYLIMGTGNDNNTWGSNANSAVFQVLEDAIANALTSTVTGGTLDLSGSPPPAAASQVRYAALIFNGTLGSNQIIKVPDLTKFWWVQNQTTGAYTLTIKTPSGAAVAVPQNSGWQLVMADGATDIIVSPFNSVQIQMPDGSAGAPPFSDVNETNSGWYRHGTQDWRLSVGGSDVLQVTGAGAGTPSVVNVLSPNALQLAGTQIIPPGVEAPYAGITLPTGWYFEDGAAVSRSTDAALFNAITVTFVGSTNGNTSITGITTDMRGKGLNTALVEGTGIATGTTITFTGATTATLSAGATGSHAGLTLRVLPWGQGDASTTFNVPDSRYRALVGRDDMNNNPAGRSSAFAGTNLNTTGGEESHTLLTAEMPSHSHTATDSGHTHTGGAAAPTVFASVQGGGNGITAVIAQATTASGTANITVSSSGSGGSHNNMQPFGIRNIIIKR